MTKRLHSLLDEAKVVVGATAVANVLYVTGPKAKDSDDPQAWSVGTHHVAVKQSRCEKRNPCRLCCFKRVARPW